MIDQLLGGNRRAIARAISWIEEGGPRARELMTKLTPVTEQSRAHVIGLTGPPGAGKSSLTDQLIVQYRKQGRRIAVIAVDPTSPFSGGAVLGDRVRMNRHALDSDVFIRSMGTRGSLGGLARPVREVVRILMATRFDVVILETVGVGQSELDVMHVADTVMVVVTPASGDQVQAVKAGIMEIADLFVVNKADLPGAAKMARGIRDMLDIRMADTSLDGVWRPPVLQTVSLDGKGLQDVLQEIHAHAAFLAEGDRLILRRGRQRVQELRELLQAMLLHEVDRELHENQTLASVVQKVRLGDENPGAAAERLIRLILSGGIVAPPDRDVV